MKKILRALGVLICLLITAMYMLPGVQKIISLPDEVTVRGNDSSLLDIGLPVKVKITGDSLDALKVNGETLSEKNVYNLDDQLELTMNGESADITLNVFGILPIKSIKLVSGDVKQVVLGGHAIGVTLYTSGALVVGSSSITLKDGSEKNPASEAGLHVGDVITAVDGVTVQDSDHLSTLIGKLSGNAITLSVLRDEKHMDIVITPVADGSDGKYRIGVWGAGQHSRHRHAYLLRPVDQYVRRTWPCHY